MTSDSSTNTSAVYGPAGLPISTKPTFPWHTNWKEHAPTRRIEHGLAVSIWEGKGTRILGRIPARV